MDVSCYLILITKVNELKASETAKPMGNAPSQWPSQAIGSAPKDEYWREEVHDKRRIVIVLHGADEATRRMRYNPKQSS